ncbi:MAG TPA: PfkB family carbohydrate kinase [Acidimicrobiales bacterium]|nr:PfkB family carbohydrate kinase [Acidimicrobiales bacterium]
MSVVVVVGDVMNDVVVRALGPVEVGSDTESEIRRSPGGSGANQAAWLATLGVPVRFYARVGASDLEEHVSALRLFGVDACLTADPELCTGSIVVLVEREGERSMFTDRGANLRLVRDDLPRDLDGVAGLHVSGYALFEPATRRAVADLIAEAVRESVPVSIDPSSESYLRALGPGRFLSLTAGVETIFPNAPEARLLTGCKDVGEAARALCARYPTAVVKLGKDGALLAARGRSPVHVDAPDAEVVDTTGAGDAFCAGYLGASYRGAVPLDALRAALETAAAALGHLGGRPRWTGGAWAASVPPPQAGPARDR